MMRVLRRNRWLIVTVVLFFGANTALLWSDALAVIQTGMCPAAPTDIPPYPCNIFEFLARMFFSPFAIAGQIVILFGCAIFGAIISLLIGICEKFFQGRTG